ncbi:MAG: molybdenum cofactor biosynthesis protein MoaE [Acidobacteria bacterium]|nr:molybdenum cofactor biosynthesis protein MoaE [Acidobacteriota bacterium]
MLKDVIGVSEQDLELAAGSRLSAVFAHYSVQFPRLAAMSASVVVAHNRQFASQETELSEGDEVALLPPVSGGSGRFTHEVSGPDGHFFALTHQPIDGPALEARLLEGHDGAVLTFAGVVRNNSRGRRTLYLDYECYEPMAIGVMAELGREIAGKYQVSRIGMIHRLGRMEIGEASVVIVVSSPHRKAAYDASLEAINRLKKIVPIWKKEHFEDGEIWVEGEWDETVKP